MASSNLTAEQHAATSALLLSFLSTDAPGIITHCALGLMPAFFISGYCFSQLIQYFSMPKNTDPIWVKTFIITMMILLELQLGTQFANLWYLIINFETYYLWYDGQWKLQFVEFILIGCVMGPGALGLIGFRTWKLYNKPIIPGVLGVMLILGLILSGALTAQLGFTFDLNPMGTVEEIYAAYNPEWPIGFYKRMTAMITFDMVINVLLTAANLYKFKTFRDEGNNTSVVRQLVLMVLQSMLPSAAVTIGMEYFFLSSKAVGKWIYTLSHIQPSLYVLACLTAVNSKRHIRAALLHNNMEIRVISEEMVQTDPSEDYLDSSRGMITTNRNTETDKSASNSATFVDDDFLGALASAPGSPVQTKRRSIIDKIGITYGKSRATLIDEEKAEP